MLSSSSILLNKVNEIFFVIVIYSKKYSPDKNDKKEILRTLIWYDIFVE